MWACLVCVNTSFSVLCRLLLDVSRRLEDPRQRVLWMQSVQGEPWHCQSEPASPGQGGPQEVLVLLWEGRHPEAWRVGFFHLACWVKFPVTGSYSQHAHTEVRKWNSCSGLSGASIDMAFQAPQGSHSQQGRTCWPCLNDELKDNEGSSDSLFHPVPCLLFVFKWGITDWQYYIIFRCTT